MSSSDYDGTLILVSHDRDFIDRLATSTIALNGRGEIVETPGGWSDFQSQNPGFLESPDAQPRRSKAKAPPPARKAAKLSFKDEHRLGVLEERLPALADEIAALEAKLADPALFQRDPAAFARATAAIDKARRDLADGEAEWLEIETRREALTAS